MRALAILTLALVPLAAVAADKEKAARERVHRKRIAEARRTNDCSLVRELPGVMPLGPAEDQRFVLACWLSEGYLVHDAALAALDVPHQSLVPPLIHALELEPALPDGNMVCTTAHILAALKKITGADAGKTAEQWREWQKAQTPK